MPEVGLGLPLERFTLVARGDVYCVVDFVDQDAASIVLTPVPDASLDLEAAKARQLVSAWKMRAELEPQSYEVRVEQRAV